MIKKQKNQRRSFVSSNHSSQESFHEFFVNEIQLGGVFKKSLTDSLKFKGLVLYHPRIINLSEVKDVEKNTMHTIDTIGIFSYKMGKMNFFYRQVLWHHLFILYIAD